MRVVTFIAALALAIVIAPDAQAADAPSGTLTIGDSVMLGARPALLAEGVDSVDAMKNRQATALPAILRQRKKALPRNIVVHLGTNGSFPDDTCRRLVDAAGAERRVFLLTLSVPRRWEAGNNEKIWACGNTYPSRVTIIDWHTAVKRHPGWVAGDRVHLRPEGMTGYARLIARSIANPE